jgi:hypothetical protein
LRGKKVEKMRWFRSLEMDEMKMSVDFSPCGGVRGVAVGEKGLADEPVSR